MKLFTSDPRIHANVLLTFHLMILKHLADVEISKISG